MLICRKDLNECEIVYRRFRWRRDAKTPKERFLDFFRKTPLCRRGVDFKSNPNCGWRKWESRETD